MFLKSLYLKNFKRFDELKIDFPDDITVVIGPNEKGKSTLVSAIIAGLFYDPKKRNREIEVLRSWQSPDKFYEIKMEFEANGENCVLLKDFERKKIFFENQATGEKSDDFQEITEKFRQIGGYRNAKLFESTSCVRQEQIASVAVEKKELGRALEDLIGGGFGSRGFGEIIQRLEKAVADREALAEKLKAEIEKVSTESQSLRRTLDTEIPQGEARELLIETLEKSAAEFDRAGNLLDAFHLYRRVLRLDPHNIRALYEIAAIYYSAGILPQSAESLRLILEIAPAQKKAKESLEAIEEEMRGG